MEFIDQVVVVSGGTRGIGASVVQAFLKKGAVVFATYKSNDQAAEEFKSSLGELAENLELRKFDVSEKESVKAFWDELEEREVTVDVLVNNSGIRRDNLTASMSLVEWDQVMDINLKGSFLMSQRAVLSMMKKRYGRIINMSSIGGLLGLQGQANYAASKAGQIAMSKTLSKEVGKRGITVNNVLPGFIDTELLDGLSSEQIKEYKKEIPLKRFGKAHEVSHVVTFLASKEASYITGASIEVSGGL